MQSIAGVVGRVQAAGVGRVTRRAVEVDDSVEAAAGADPSVDCLARPLPMAVLVVVHVVAAERGERPPVHADALRVRTDDDLLIGRDQPVGGLLLRRRRRFGGTDVVDALEAARGRWGRDRR